VYLFGRLLVCGHDRRLLASGGQHVTGEVLAQVRRDRELVLVGERGDRASA
jgi:hypothetical protein